MSRDPITITDAAKSHISQILAQNPGKCFYIAVDSKGCAGMKYRYDLIETADPKDDVISGDWGTVVVDRISVLHLLGSKLDLRAEGLNTQLVWDNPMASSTCGCGESFSIGKGGCRDDSSTNPEAVL